MMRMKLFNTFRLAVLLAFAALLTGCQGSSGSSEAEKEKIPVILDTDANNELDDQHALAYLLLNDEVFDVAGITVNATWGGGEIENHVEEAERIVQLCNLGEKVRVYAGANGGFTEISEHLEEKQFDGSDAVDFLIRSSKETRPSPLVVLAVGKLTNVALAVKKEPEMADRIRLVWLGSNYPEPGEYNQDNDTAAMNFLLNTGVPFEMVTVRYGLPTGTGAVTIRQAEIEQRMPGLGPRAKEPVTGRHGGTFQCFGDYSVNLFEHIDYGDSTRTRSLFDLAAVAIVKNPEWAMRRQIPAPILMENQWVERPWNQRKITVWENFERQQILSDLFQTLEASTPH
jgi:purine nucleosidase